MHVAEDRRLRDILYLILQEHQCTLQAGAGRHRIRGLGPVASAVLPWQVPASGWLCGSHVVLATVNTKQLLRVRRVPMHRQQLPGINGILDCFMDITKSHTKGVR